MFLHVTVPVLNEAACLRAHTERLHCFLRERFCEDWELLLVDNGSTDATPQIAAELECELKRVSMMRIEEPGRGGALRAAWTHRSAEVLAYMDADLACDLEAFPQLIQPLASKEADLAMGSRLIPGARVTRSLKREVLSRIYNVLVRRFCGVPFRDTQCGFKAIRHEAAQRLLPQVQNDHWFFDTELLVLASIQGYRVKEVPVTWTESPRSSVRLWSTILEDLSGLARLRKRARNLK